MFVVAGVTGRVGRVAANELLAQNKRVKVIVRDAAKAHDWSKRGAEVAVGSVEDEKFLTDALRGAEGFFTLLPPNMAAPDFYAWQRKTSETIATAVKSSGVPHVVMLSSIGADLAEGTGPIKGLHYLEKALGAAGCKLTAIRAGFFQENIAGNVGAAKEAGVYPNFGGSPEIATPMIATKDIGHLVAQSLMNPPVKSDVVDLYGPSYSARQLAEKLGAALGKTLQVVNIPPQGHVDAFVKAGLPKQFAEGYAEMYAGFASGKIQLCGDRKVKGDTTIDECIASLVR